MTGEITFGGSKIKLGWIKYKKPFEITIWLKLDWEKKENYYIKLKEKNKCWIFCEIYLLAHAETGLEEVSD